MKKLEKIMQKAEDDLLAYVDEEKDEDFEEYVRQGEAEAMEVAEALGIAPEEFEASCEESPMQGHADLAVPKLLDLTKFIEGEPMRSAITAIPAFEEKCPRRDK